MGLCSSKQSDEVAKEPEVKEAEKVEEEVPKEDEPKKAEEEPVEKEEEPKEAEAEPTSEEEVVQCAKVWLGQIIGPGGSTLKELQESTGANIDVAQGEEDPVPITITGSPGAVADAKQKIEAIIKEAENPDYEGEEGKKWREEADNCAKKAEECAKEKDALFDSGDKAGGHAKLAEVKEWQKKMHEANDKAAEAIFDHRNAGKGDRYMDFHGLRKKEAMDILEKKMAALEGKGGEVELIPGAGHHSSGDAVLKPAVVKFLKDKGLEYEEKNAGTFIVKL